MSSTAPKAPSRADVGADEMTAVAAKAAATEAVRVDEAAVRVDEAVVRVDEAVVRADGAVVQADETAVALVAEASQERCQSAELDGRFPERHAKPAIPKIANEAPSESRAVDEVHAPMETAIGHRIAGAVVPKSRLSNKFVAHRRRRKRGRVTPAKAQVQHHKPCPLQRRFNTLRRRRRQRLQTVTKLTRARRELDRNTTLLASGGYNIGHSTTE